VTGRTVRFICMLGGGWHIAKNLGPRGHKSKQEFRQIVRIREELGIQA